jgi:hypothetical protein
MGVPRHVQNHYVSSKAQNYTWAKYYAKTNSAKIIEILENFDCTSLFRHALNLLVEDEAANDELDKGVS